MLTYLKVHNLALMDHLEIDFHEGFSALTGETGAGKSILIESIGFVLGERSNKESIRNGESKAYVEACFKVNSNSSAAAFLKENDLYDSDEVIVYRDMTSSGRSSARINGTLVSVAEVKKLGDLLLDFHGQHAHQSLLDETTHLSLVDLFAGDGKAITAMHEARAMTIKLRKEIAEADKNLSNRLHRLEEIESEVGEINKANLIDGEEDELLLARKKARNSSLIEEKLSKAYAFLHGEEGVLSNTSAASAELAELKDICEEYAGYSSQIDSAYYILEDISGILRDALQSFSFSESDLNDIESRLFLIENLKRKYGINIREILAYRDSLISEKEKLEKADVSFDELKKREASAFESFLTAASVVSENRKATAAHLESTVTEHLRLMGMPNACFSVKFNELDPKELNERGIEDAVFLFSANLGSPLKSLAKTASGGEASRVMLAIKAALAQADTIGTLIFDEIDTGISGMIAHTVAKQMQELSTLHQIICVTHLPQIAAAADFQYYIYKTESADSTVSRVTLLSEEERPKELARIMGSDQTSAGLEHAKELLKNAKMRNRYIENQ